LLLLTLAACRRQGFSRPDDQYEKAKVDLERGQLIESLQLASDGARRYSNTQPAWGARFRVLEAEVLIWQGKATEALSLLNDPLPQSVPDEALVRQKLLQATARYRLQEFDQSTTDLSEAEELARSKKPDLLADIAMTHGTLAMLTGHYEDAKTFYESALEMARQQNRLFLETSILGNLGVLDLRQQRCGESIDWFAAVQANANRLQNETIGSRALVNLGWCYYMLGDFDRALDTYAQVLSISTKLGTVQDQLVSLNNIGLIHDAQRDFVGAITYYKKSLDIAHSLGDRSAAIIALNNLAYSSLTTGRLDEADRYNQESIRLQKESGDNTWRFGSILNSARIAFGRKQYPEAVRLFREVIHGAGNDESLRWEAESNLAALYAAEDKPVAADLQYKKGLETIDRARASLIKDDHRLSFLNTATRFYNDYIDFLVAHHRERDALAVAEHSRARTLAEGLKIPVELRAAAFHPEENARRVNSVVLSYWLKPERSYLWVVTPTRVQLFTLPPQKEIDAAVDEYRKALVGPSQARDSAAGQKLYQILVAPAEKLIFANSRHPERSGLQAAESRDPHSSPTATGLEKIPPHLTATLTRSEKVAPHLNAGFRPASLTRVARTRDARSTSSVPRVIVIADGSLVNLNFETLMVPAPQPHYWIEDATISNASSIALLRSSSHNVTIARSSDRTMSSNGTMARSHDGTISPARSHDGKISSSMLLIGAPNYSGTEFPELSQAKTEVAKVEAYFPENERTVIEGKSAVPSAYDAAKPGEFTYIHFVAHGTASRLSPLDSSIVLSKQGDAYKLYARDIMQQPLKADLVTISACYGAGNRSYSGEGLVGLSWAFLRAGAHHVIAALWEVNDASTPQLMDNLYLNIKNGEDPATALRHAKLDMLHSDNVYRRPFYWGAFQIYVGS
jgi:CHAT domain-containing protein/Tfp pilus assembly protein PilF